MAQRVALRAASVAPYELLVIGSLPLFVGLAVVMPVLGHATWHLYRRVVEPNPNPPEEPPQSPRGKALCRGLPGQSLPVEP